MRRVGREAQDLGTMGLRVGVGKHISNDVVMRRSVSFNEIEGGRGEYFENL